MSLAATLWAWRQQGVRPSAKYVLVAIAERAGKDCTAWPSYKQIVVDTLLDRKTISESIKALKAAGLLVDTGQRVGRTGQIPVFRLPVAQAGGKELSNNPEIGTLTSPESAPESNDFQLTPTVPKTESFKATQKRNSPKNGTVPKTDGKDPENGIRNLSGTVNTSPNGDVSHGVGTLPCPHLEIIAAYHEILPQLRRVIPSRWNGARERDLRARWQESHKHQDLRFWRWLFGFVATQRFYLGENDRAWRADLGWLVKREKFNAMVERADDAQHRTAPR